MRSNAIVLAKDLATVGHRRRPDEPRRLGAARRSRRPGGATRLEGAALASDAFFPFADGPQVAIDAGVTAIIQPGGSKRDHEVIEACDEAGIAMVFTAPPPLPALRLRARLPSGQGR